MDPHIPNFHNGDRVRARSRPDFPEGTVMQLLEDGFLIVRWDGGLLETIHREELETVAHP